MKKITLLLLAAFTAAASAQVYVQPHVNRDGTYVPGHHRSAPDRTVDNNYGTRGNYNPYTGQSGTAPRSYEQPYQAPSYQQPSNTYGSTCGYTAAGRYVCR